MRSLVVHVHVILRLGPVRNLSLEFKIFFFSLLFCLKIPLSNLRNYIANRGGRKKGLFGLKRGFTFQVNESCGFSTVFYFCFLGHIFSVAAVSFFTVQQVVVFLFFVFFLAYIFVHIDDKKPYKPFNQLDTSLSPTALLIVSETKTFFLLKIY